MTVGWKRWMVLAWLWLIPSAGNAVTPVIAAGYSATYALKSDGTVWVWGKPGGLVSKPVATQVDGLNAVIAVCAKTYSGLALKSDGTVWGIPAQGSAYPLGSLTAISAIACGSTHDLALKSDNTVWAWGSNVLGTLGDGTLNNAAVPVQVKGLSGVTAIVSDAYASFALKSDGTVWAWGSESNSGDLGVGPVDECLITNPSSSYTAACSKLPRQVTGLTGVIAIAAGSQFAIALKTDGTVWGWGENFYGQVGNTTGQKLTAPAMKQGIGDVIAITAGKAHAIALKGDGTLWAWGRNADGELGNGTASASSAGQSAPVQVAGLTGVSVVVSAYEAYRSFASRADGSVWAWGNNDSGALGDNTQQNQLAPVRVSGAGGVGFLNLLGAGSGAAIDRLTVNGATDVVARTATTYSAQVTYADGTSKTVSPSWSVAGSGVSMSGSGVLTAAAVSQDTQVTVSAAYTESGVTKTASLGIVIRTRLPVAVKPSLSSNGGSHTAALMSDGTVWSWGSNGDGQLGDASRLERNIPVQVNDLTSVVSVVATNNNGFALKTDGTVWAWGNNFVGGLGDGTTSDRQTPVRVQGLGNVKAIGSGERNSGGFAIMEDGSVWQWGQGSPKVIAGLANITAVAAASGHTLALKSDGTVWAWGFNDRGQLGDGTTTTRQAPAQVPGLTDVVAVAASSILLGVSRSVAVKADGTVWSWGDGAYGALGDGTLAPRLTPAAIPGLQGVVAATASSRHTLVLKADGTVWSWGQNFFGALGDGTTTDRNTPVQVKDLTDVIGIGAGSAHSVALRRDGTVWTWGLGAQGQLGDGTYVVQQLTPILTVNAAVDGFLDLLPAVANTIPPGKVPPFLVATNKSGGLSSTSLSADVKGPTAGGSFASTGDLGRFAAAYNVYVAASVPSGSAALYFQLDSGNSWSSLRWPMAEFLRNVTLDTQSAVVRAQILQNVDVSGLAGTSVIVGYGTDPDEMLRAARYRTIFTVPQQ